ncbi:hypothetical protein TrVE_jg8874 [Triparma verrucosa]|uniref:Serine hydrolase domain-containing protein n=1 Tax=Triparma verrucosa TaxID=1606542 RepID=A0A9W7C5X3_9STRA|nr:hypothetical protein TrVE_jg8874 [Triparma verrucosa]
MSSPSPPPTPSILLPSESTSTTTPTTPVRVPTSEPRTFLALHGWCQDSSLFSSKTSRLSSKLLKTLNIKLHYVSAPHPVPPSSTGSYQNAKSWYHMSPSDPSIIHTRFEKKQKYYGLEESIKLITEEFTRTKASGIIGFSQGASLAHLCCILSEQSLEPFSSNLKQAILVGSLEFSCVDYPVTSKLTKVRTLHVSGIKDTQNPPLKNRECYDAFSNGEWFEFNGGHVVPNNDTFVSRISDFIEYPKTTNDWSNYLSKTLLSTSSVPSDFGLTSIASYLSQSPSIKILDLATSLETSGSYKPAIKEYTKAYKLWPALDSVLAGGIPRGVREEAIEYGYKGRLLTDVSVSKSRNSIVEVSKKLLDYDDVHELLKLAGEIEVEDGGRVVNNFENLTHVKKYAIMVNGGGRLRKRLPKVLGKVVRFAEQALRDSKWCEEDGPLRGFNGGCGSLTVRVAEVWTYEVGGGLVDNWHYDTDSIVTIVCLLSERGEFKGGDFQTYEDGDINISHPMEKGDGVCFVSHKYHNITEVEGGERRSLVVELWEGEEGKKGR